MAVPKRVARAVRLTASNSVKGMAAFKMEWAVLIF
jgi:hypothetical protein